MDNDLTVVMVIPDNIRDDLHFIESADIPMALRANKIDANLIRAAFGESLPTGYRINSAMLLSRDIIELELVETTNAQLSD